ncbi:hypothetical protein [Anaeroselena agilis]|uniref:Uncharacterized protein n=1 Tax=Anaeroselena agilis TaxID=3063788 RepID=A0ABU3P5X1_9FIRM|nr:hypothetical protein [Selenomonadales bacterium 4137-cl]
MVVKSAKDLWCDYLFLTREMAKFLAKEDLEMFQNLMDQRERLQQLIDDNADNHFAASDEGRKILTLIRDTNTGISLAINGRYSRNKKIDLVDQAYAGGNAPPAAGSRMNRMG